MHLVKENIPITSGKGALLNSTIEISNRKYNAMPITKENEQ
jgi:hypothetical protein